MTQLCGKVLEANEEILEMMTEKTRGVGMNMTVPPLLGPSPRGQNNGRRCGLAQKRDVELLVEHQSNSDGTRWLSNC